MALPYVHHDFNLIIISSLASFPSSKFLCSFLSCSLLFYQHIFCSNYITFAFVSCINLNHHTHVTGQIGSIIWAEHGNHTFMAPPSHRAAALIETDDSCKQLSLAFYLLIYSPACLTSKTHAQPTAAATCKTDAQLEYNHILLVTVYSLR